MELLQVNSKDSPGATAAGFLAKKVLRVTATLQGKRFHCGLREKILAALVLVCAAQFALNAWFTQSHMQNLLSQQQQTLGRTIANVVAQQLHRAPNNYIAVHTLLTQWVESGAITAVELHDSHGALLGIAGSKMALARMQANRNTRHREVVATAGRVFGELTLQDNPQLVSVPLTSWRRMTLGATLLSIILVVVAGHRLLGKVLVKPLHALKQNIRDNEDSIIDEVEEQTHDDFAYIAQRFNSLRQLQRRTQHLLESARAKAEAKLDQLDLLLSKKTDALVETNRALKKNSFIDPLTGLFDRRYFERMIDGEITRSLRKNIPYSIIVAEIDGFLSINNNFSVRTGSLVLQQLSQLILANKQSENISCRIGGKKFTLLCQGLNIDKTALLAVYLCNKINRHLFGNNHEKISISVSIGCASFPNAFNTHNGEDLHKCAEVALDHSKENGGNRVTHFDTIMNNLRQQT